MNHKGEGGVREEETKPPFTIVLFLDLYSLKKTKAPPTNHQPHVNALKSPQK